MSTAQRTIDLSGIPALPSFDCRIESVRSRIRLIVEEDGCHLRTDIDEFVFIVSKAAATVTIKEADGEYFVTVTATQL